MKFLLKQAWIWIAVTTMTLCLPGIGNAQEFRATISGTVTDPAGAVVPDASVVIRETRTGTLNKTTSDSAGQYVVPFLLPGSYQITVTSTGFRTLTRNSVTLQSGDHPLINFALQLGNTSETVNVTADAPLIDQANASVGQVITTSQVEDLPLSGRTPAMLAQLAIGVIATAQPVQVHPFDNNAGNSWSIGGTPKQTSEVLLDGSPDTTWSGSVAYSPTQDSVQEVSVRTFDTDASFGHTFGGVINQITKSGTNQLHGSVYEFATIKALGANNWFNKNRADPLPRPSPHFDQYGITIGGPVFLPKLFDGRNKLFFFFAWEGLKDGQTKSVFTTVPTAAERGGDFSALLSGACPNGLANDPNTAAALCNPDKTHSAKYANPNQLYNPFTAKLTGSSVTRSPILNNNLLKAGALNSIGLSYLDLMPQPNSPGTAVGLNNYLSTPQGTNDYNNEFGRIDWSISPQNHLFVDVRHNLLFQQTNNFFNNAATGKTLNRENWGAVVDDVYTLNPTTILNLRANWTFFGESHGTPATALSPSTVGFPAYMDDQSRYVQLPYIEFATNGTSCSSQNSFQCLGDTGSSITPSETYQMFGDVVKVLKRHTLKVGLDARRYRVSVASFGASSGSFTFADSFMTSGSGGAHVAFGADLASLLLGLPTGGSYFLGSRADYTSYYYGTFVQDDWRVNDQLTLNLGLRFDTATPYGEKLGRTVNGFDRGVMNSVSASAASNYAAHPIPQVPVSAFSATGGLTFADRKGGAPYQVQSNLFSPRIGFSYSPSWMHNRTVIRGGFGMFVLPQTLATMSATGTYSTAALANQQGYSATTALVSTNNNYLTSASSLSTPFSGGFTQPTGSLLGVNTYLGQGISYLAPVQHDMYSERWNIGVQHSLTANTLLEVLYIGNHGVHLPVATQNINSTGRQYLSTLPYRDVALNSAYSATATNPFAGLLPGTSLNANTVSVATLLNPYPEFGGVNIQNQSTGQSNFNSINVRLEQRMRYGLSVVANYGFSKLMEVDTFLNDQDPSLTRRISPYDSPHHFVLGSTYRLPFGRNRKFSFGGSRILDEIFGGYAVNAIYRFQTGNPVYFTADIPLQPGTSLRDIQSNPRRVKEGPALTTSAFVTGSANAPSPGGSFVDGQFAYHLRTLPQTLSWVRADGINNLDASLLKDFHFSEKSYVQIRFETFNTFNHAVFGAPAVSSATSTGFGAITSQANTPRIVQIGGRIVF